MATTTFDRRTELVFLLPTFAIIFNCLLSFFDRGGGLAAVKGLVFIGLLIYLYIGKMEKSFSQFAIFFLLVIYWLMLVPVSTGQERSVQSIIRAGLSILMLPLGYCYINTPQKIARFAYIQLNICIIFIGFAIIANIFKVGVNQYGGAGGVRVGLFDAQLYAPALALALVPFIFQTFQLPNPKKYRIYLICLMTFVLLMISMRRTSVGIAILGISIFYVTSGKINRLVSIFLSVFLVLVVTFPLYGDLLLERMALRADVFQNDDYEMTEELRYQELFFVLKDLSDNFSVFTLLFGKEIFNSPGHYGITDGFLATRQIHVDYTVLFHGSGLVGLLTYVGMLGRVFYLFQQRYKKFKHIFKQFAIDVRAMFLSAFIMVVLISFSGQMEEMSFRSLLFLTLGSCLGVMYNTTNKIKLAPHGTIIEKRTLEPSLS